MANELPEQSQFDETIEAILTTEPVKGDPPAFQGQPTGKINVILLKLANRSRWLKNALANPEYHRTERDDDDEGYRRISDKGRS